LEKLELKKRSDGSWIGILCRSIMFWIKYACGMCSPLHKLSKMSKIIELDFGAKSYSRFSDEHSVTGRESGQHLQAWS
jgi:hypothetical protein